MSEFVWFIIGFVTFDIMALIYIAYKWTQIGYTKEDKLFSKDYYNNIYD